MEMTRKRLDEYKSEKQEIKELRVKLDNLDPADYIDNDVINDYRSGYSVPQAVIGVDDKAYLRRYRYLKSEIVRLEQRCRETEQWIEEIPDSLTRRIFRMYYEDGQGQQAIALQLHMDQSNISKKINNYFKTKNNKSQLSNSV